MIRSAIIYGLLLASSAGSAEAALSPTLPGGPQLERPSPAVVQVGGHQYRAANVLIGGARVQAPAFLRGDRSWLPARAVLSRLGGSVEWVPNERAFYASFPARNIVERVALGSRAATVYRFDTSRPHLAGAKIRTETLPSRPFLARNQAYAPLRGLVEAAGGRLNYYPASRTVYVTIPDRVGLPAPSGS